MQIDKSKDSWSPSFWNATGNFSLDVAGLGLSSEVEATYYKAGSSPDYTEDTIIVTSEPYTISGDNAMFSGGAKVQLNSLILEKDASGEWEAASWEAMGSGALGTDSSVNFAGCITASYYKNGIIPEDSATSSSCQSSTESTDSTAKARITTSNRQENRQLNKTDAAKWSISSQAYNPMRN